MSGEKMRLKNQILSNLQNTVLLYVLKSRFVKKIVEFRVIFSENRLNLMKFSRAMSRFSTFWKKNSEICLLSSKIRAYMGNVSTNKSD